MAQGLVEFAKKEIHRDDIKSFLERRICNVHADFSFEDVDEILAFAVRRNQREKLINEADDNFQLWKDTHSYEYLREFESCVEELIEKYGIE